MASIQVDFTDDVLQQFQDDLLSLLWSSGVSTVILDASGIQIMDGEDFESLVHVLKMVALMGARPMIAGLRPGVVASLIELDVNVGQIDSALNLDHAFSLVEARSSGAEEGGCDAMDIDEEVDIEGDCEGDKEVDIDEVPRDVGA